MLGLVVLAVCGVASLDSAQAQGLIWNLPEDGTEVRFEGTITQIEFRPDSAEGDIEIEWIHNLTLKSVGRQEAEFEGSSVPCRWIEIKVETGKISETGVDTGPVGGRIYKVLVPESRVSDQQRDADKIPVSFLPIIQGFQKIGEEEPVEMQTKALQIFPLLSRLMHYESLKGDGEEQPLEIPLGEIPAKKWVGSRILENLSTRTVNEAEIWQSNEVPFGLAQWSVKSTRSAKDNSEPRSAFKPMTILCPAQSSKMLETA